MVNVGFGWSSIMGLLLVVLGISIVPLGLKIRQEFDIMIFVENVVLSIVYVTSGVIIILYGWSIGPILQFCQFLLVAATCYLSLKNMLRRS